MSQVCGKCYALCLGRERNISFIQTRSDLEAATMHKLKGQPSNTQPGQSFKNNELIG